MALEMSYLVKDRFVRSIQSAMREARSYMLLKDTPTNIGGPTDKWDFIIKYILKNMDDNHYLTGIIEGLGFYKPIFVYDYESRILFSIMRDTNYKTLLRGKKKITYYVNSALSINQSLQGQISMFEETALEISQDDHEVLQWKKSLIMDHVGISEDKVACYITVVFKESEYMLQKVTAYLTNQFYEVIDFMDWSEFIRPDIGDNDPVIGEKSEIDLPIGIKPGILEEQMSDGEAGIDIHLKSEKKEI